MDPGLLNAGTVSAVSNILMAVIWIVYLQILFIQYRRTTRPFMLIHHAHENDIDALCLFVNMSKEAIHVQSVIANIHTEEGSISRQITDYNHIPQNDQEVQIRLRQGPIKPGSYLVLGSFKNIIMDPVLYAKGIDAENTERVLSKTKSLEICVAVVHGQSTHHIGARRQFFVEHQAGRFIIRAHNIHTEQLISFSKRKIVRNWIESRVEPKHRGESETQKTRQSRQQNETKTK
jgi:hypothetical protein